MNTSASWPDPETAELRVRRMQRKLHHWAVDETDRCFDDLYNLVHDPAFLTVAWEGCGRTRVRVPLEPTGSHHDLSPGGGGRTASAAPSGAQGAGVPAGSGAGGDDPEGERQAPPPGYRDSRRPGRASFAEAGDGARLRGGLSSVLIRVPATQASPGRHRRDPLPRQRLTGLSLGFRGRHHGVLRRNLAFGPHGPGAATHRGQTRSGPGEVVPQGWDSLEDLGHRELSLVLRKAEFCHRCSAMSPCPFWTSTSTRSGRRSARTGHAPSIGVPESRR